MNCRIEGNGGADFYVKPGAHVFVNGVPFENTGLPNAYLQAERETSSAASA